MTTRHDSVPFLLVRPPSSVEDVLDDAETTEIPAAKSVPPHAPPARVTTMENHLPSVIVDLHSADAREEPEAQRESSVDGLLDASERRTLPLPVMMSGPSEVTLPSVEARPARGRGVLIALLAAAMAAGGTFAVVRVLHLSSQSLSAALHIVR
jgi:hypothetical protein